VVASGNFISCVNRSIARIPLVKHKSIIISKSQYDTLNGPKTAMEIYWIQ